MKIKKRNGKTKLETMLVMLLLIVFGISTYTLVVATTSSYAKNQTNTVAKDNLRLATSYIDSKLRQSDSKHITIGKYIDGSDCLVIEEIIDNATYKNIIYFSDGVLQEALIEKDTNLNEIQGFDIAYIDSFSIEKTKQDIIKVTVSTISKEDEKKYSATTITNIGL